jgi:hypothetical protein
MSTGMWTLKAMLMRIQVEIRTLLGNGLEATLGHILTRLVFILPMP